MLGIVGQDRRVTSKRETMKNEDARFVKVAEGWFRALEWLIIRAAMLILLLYELVRFVAGQWHGLVN